MQQHDSVPSDFDVLQPNSGGAAPAHRTCRYTKADGNPCRDWAIRGQDYCHRHDLFLHSRVERPIDVPLLEDEASIVLLLSETLRALAWGTIPVNNGRMLLAGCRLAHTMQCQRLETAKFRAQLRRTGIPEHEIVGPPNDPRREATSAQSAPEPVAPCSESPDEPLTTPLLQPPNQSRHRFRDLKKNWNKELGKVETEMADMCAPRYKETREDFLASRALPFDHLEAIDREVEKARAMAAALVAENAAATVNN